MIQPNGDKKRKSVAATQYDSQFELQGIEFKFPELDLDKPIAPEGYMGLISTEQLEEYEGLGVRYSPGMDIMRELSENQSTLNKIGNVLVRGGIGAAVAAVEPFAYLLDIENHIAALQGADRDYDNFLTKGLRGIEESVREDFPIYTATQDPDIASADWWFQNTDQVLRSIGYLVPGGALFKGANIAGKAVFGTAAKLTGKSISGSAAASALNAGSALGSATLLNYGEHAVSAARHIEENLPELTQKYITNGMDPAEAATEAKRTLSKQAAEIIQGGRINILWQSISQANLFRGVSHSRRLGRLKEATKGQGVRQGLKTLGIEGLTESLEEVTTGYQETQAQYKTDLELGKVVEDNRPTWEKYIDHATSYQGITEGLLGALGAGPLTLYSVMSKKSDIDALEQIKQTELAMGASGENIKKITEQQVREHAIMNALKGTSENFMEILETYKNATAKEASDLGLESNYKELAEQYIEDAKFIEDVINNELLNPLRNNQAEAFVLVNHKLNEYYALKDIENYKTKLSELKAKKDKLFQDIENNVEDKDLHEIRDIVFQRAAVQKMINTFEQSIAELQAKDLPMTRQTSETLAGEVKNLADAQETLKKVEENLELKVRDYATLNEITGSEAVERVNNLEGAGDIDAEIELYTALLEAGKIRRKNNALKYNEYVTNPDLLKQEGEKAIKENEKQQKAQATARQAKQKAQKQQQAAKARQKAKNTEAVNKKAQASTAASQAQQAAGGTPLTADSPIGERKFTSDELAQDDSTIKTEYYTITDGDGNSQTVEVKTSKDGSRRIELKDEEGTRYSSEKFSKDNPVSNEQLIDGMHPFAEDEGYSLTKREKETREGFEANYSESIVENRKAKLRAELASPIFEGEVNNGKQDAEEVGQTNFDNSNIAPNSFNTYFEVDQEQQKGRQTKSSSSVAFLSIPYRQITVDGKKVNRSISNTKTEESKLVESRTSMMPGSEVTLKLMGADNKPLSMEALALLGEDQIDETAVAIYQNGVKVGALHTVEWISRVDENNLPINTAPGEVEDQVRHAKNIRRIIARNADQNNEIKTNVEFKGHGLILPLFAEDDAGNLVLVGDNLQKTNTSVDKAFPDIDNLDIGIVDGGQIFTGEFALKEETVIDLRDGNYNDGRVVVNLPTPNNKIFPSILFVDNLPKDQADTVIGAAVSFQNDQTGTYAAIEDNTAINFGRTGDAKGLHKFVNRYVNSRNNFYTWDEEQENNLAKNAVLVFTPSLAASETGQVQGMMQIVDIDNRTMYTNDPLFFQNNSSFVTENDIREIKDLRDPQSAQQASELLQQKLVTVRKDAINKKGEFKDVMLDIEGNVKDISTHSSYNAFKGQHLKTDINGKNFIDKQDGSREYTYMTQPIIVVNTSFAEEGAAVQQSANANQVAPKLSFASIKIQEGDPDERQIDNYKENSITKAMRAELAERLFDTRIISVTQQVEAMDSIFATYAKNITVGSFKEISAFVKNSLQEIVDTKQTRKNKKAAIQHLLDNYDLKAGKLTVEGLMIEKLNKLDILPQKEGFKATQLTDVEIDQMFAENLEADGFTQEDFVKDIYEFEFYKTNKKRTASSSIKLLLAGATKDEKAWLGGPFKKGIPYQESYDTIKATLSRTAGTFDDQLKALKKRKDDSKNPIFEKTLNLLQNGSETLQRQFFVAMSGTRLDFVFLDLKASAIGMTAEIKEADRYNTTINLKNKWFNNLKNTKLTKVIQADNIPQVIIDQDYRQKIQSDYKKLFEEYRDKNALGTPQFLKIVQKYLGEMGIEVPFEGLDFLANRSTAEDRNVYLRRKSKWSTHVDPDLTASGFPKGMMSALFNSFRMKHAAFAEGNLNKILTDKSTTEELRKNKAAFEDYLVAEKKGGFINITNPYDGPNYEKVIYGLLGLTVDFEGVIYGDSLRDSKGNMIYPYQNHFGISRLLSNYASNPEQLRKLKSLSYNKNSVWAEGLLQDENYLQVAMFDATKLEGNPTNRKEQGTWLQEVTLFNAFANQGYADSYFFPITTADKDVAPIIKAPKLQGVVENLVVENGQLTDIKDAALEQIYGYAEDEYNRIANYEKNKNPEEDRGAYEQGASYFYMFNYLNKYEDGDVDVMSMMPEEAIKHIRAAVKKNVIDQINSHVTRLQRLGVEPKFLDKKYIRKNFKQQTSLFATPADQFVGAIADFNLNYIVSNNEVVKLFGNDPAHTYKESKKDGATVKDHIKESLNNYEKRKADLISPASTPKYTSNSVTIATAVDAIKIIKNKDGSTTRVQRTDAQEYGTIREMLESKLSAGKLPKEIVDRVLAAHEAAIADPNNKRNFFRLSEVLNKKEIDQYKKIMMADKPVFIQNDIKPGKLGDSNNKLFRKSHIRYLWPEETTGYGMDNIRVAMETVGIDRLGHMTSDKTGAVNPISIYGAEGKVKSLPEVIAEMRRGARVLSREGLGIQQEKGADTGEISYSTQLDVLLFDDMLGKSLSTGESIEELRDKKEEIQIKLMRFGANRLFTKLGIKQNPDGSVYIPNPATLAKMLREEAIARKWSDKDISELALKDIDGPLERVFKSPLTFNHARKNIDALVLSLINKEITKFKMPGEALVQASSAGFEARGGLGWGQFVSDGEFDKIQNGITLIETENAFDETVGLQGVRKGPGGKILPAQILISPVFTDSKGNTIDLSVKKYKGKDISGIRNKVRYLKQDILPQELRERILYRIPGQGKPSVSPVEIVGFLPKTSTSTVIVPDEIIDQMGSDFDWDTAYTYFKQFDVNKDGTVKIKSDLSELQQLQDEYYELFKKIIFDRTTVNATSKLDNTDLKDAADNVDKILGEESNINDPSYVTTNIDNTISQRTGKQLIGPASLAAVMHAGLQGKGIQINLNSRTLEPTPFVFFKGGKENVNLELTNISAYTGKSYSTQILKEAIRTASDNVRTVQNAAVDNANEAVLGRAGINNATVDVALFTLMYKDRRSSDSIHAEQLVYFLRQEAIKMYTEEFDFFSAQIEGGFRSEEQIRNDAFNATMVKLAQKAGIDPNADYTADLNSYRTDADGQFKTFSSEDFLEQLRTSKNPNTSYYKTQMAILAGFKQLQNSSDPVRKLQRGIMSPRTKGMGSTMFEAQRTLDNMEEIFEKGLSTIGGIENLEGGQLQEMYNQFSTVFNSLSSILPFSNKSHKQMVDMWQQYTGVSTVSQNTREQLFNALLNKSFARAFEQTFNEDITEARHRLMSDPDDNIASRVIEVQESDFGQRNLFINRLLPVTPNGGMPASISYISSKQDDIADQMSVDFVALYESVEPGHRELFEDIVKYTYITGGVQTAGNFAKFMNTAYLDEIGFYDALRKEEMLLNSPMSPEAPNLSELMVEFLQHNPNRAVLVSKSEFNKIAASRIQTVEYDGKDINFQFTLKQPELSADFERVTYQPDGDNRLYLEVLSIEGELYQKMGVNEEGEILFRRIGLKGFQTPTFNSVLEYGGVNKYTQEGALVTEETIVPQNVIPKADTVNTGLPQLSKTTKPEDKSVYGFDPVRVSFATPGREGVKQLLNTVLEETPNESLNLLADVLSKNIDTKGSAITEVTMEEGLKTSNGTAAYGMYRDGKVVIDRETVVRNPELLDKVILHEMLHGFVSNEVADTKSAFSRKINYLTNAANVAFKKAVKDGKIDKDSAEYKLLEYAFGDPQEFVTNVMTESTVQNFLNNVPGTKSLWQRFKDIVKDFLKSLGINVNKDSLLAESVEEIMSFIVESTPSTAQVQQTVRKAQRAAGVLPLDPAISRAKHAIAAQSRMKAGDYTSEDFKKALEEYDKIINGLASPKIKGRDFTGRKDTVAEILSVYKERASRLRGKVTEKSIKTPEGKKLQERLNRYEDQINSLVEDDSFNNLRATMAIHLGFARKVLSSQDPTYIEILEALNIVDMYDYGKVTKKYLDSKDRVPSNKWNNLLLDQSKEASVIKANLIDKSYEIFGEKVSETLPDEIIDADSLKVMKQDRSFMSVRTKFLDLSKFDSPMVRTLDKYLKGANRAADGEINARFLQIESAFSEIENNPAFKRDPNLFFQKNEKGELTGYFLSPYSASFSQAVGKLRGKYLATVRKAKSERARNIAAATLINNLNKIEIAIDVRWFIDGINNIDSPFKSKQEYIDYLDDQLGESQRKELVEKAVKKYKNYKSLEDQKMSDILLQKQGAQDLAEYQEEINSQQQAFKERNSPIYYLNSRYGKSPKLAKNRGWKAIVTAPIKNERFYDSRYKVIENDPQLKKFMEFYKDTMKDLITLLPEGLVTALPENFFPFAKRGFMEDLQAQGLETILSSMKLSKLGDYFFKLDQELELDPRTATKGVRDPDTGEIQKNVPVRMLRGKADQKSYDIEKVMKMFTAMAVAYDYKSQVEDKILLMQRLIREAEEIQLDSKGSTLRRILGGKVSIDSKVKGLKNVKEAVDYAIDAGLYGVNKDTVEEGIVFNKQVGDIKRKFEQLQKDQASGKIGVDEFFAEKAKLDAELKELGVKPVSIKKPFERLVEYTQLKGLGWNLMSGLNNLSFGTIANYVHAAGGEDYTTAQLTKAYGILFKELTPGIANKAYNLAIKYGVLFEQLDTYYGKNKRKQSKFMSAIDPFILQTITENANQITPFIAKMLNTTVDDKGTTLYDMYDENGDIKEEFKDLESDWTTRVDAETENKFTAFRDASIEMNKINHGNYDPNSALLVKKEVWGRVFTQFRTWAFEGFNTRFGEKVYNAQLGRWTEGRYKAYREVGFKGVVDMLLKDLLNTLTLGFGVSEASMRGDIKDDLVYANMRKNLSALKFYGSVMIAGALLKNLAADEEDEALQKRYRLLVNTFYRLEQDAEFYSNPKTAMEILRNPAPIIKTILDAGSAMSATYDYVRDAEGYEESRRDPLSYKWAKTVPFGNSVRSIQYLSETQIEKD